MQTLSGSAISIFSTLKFCYSQTLLLSESADSKSCFYISALA